MYINCKYSHDDNAVVVYHGFEVTGRFKPELNKTFFSDNPPSDYREASAYAYEVSDTDDGYISCSSSVDNFVMDSGDEFEWYTDEFGQEWFDYEGNISALFEESNKKRDENMRVLVFYFQNTLAVNDAFAGALAKSTYDAFGQYIMPKVLAYESNFKEKQSLDAIK